MNHRDDDSFRLKPAAPRRKQSRRGERFISQVLRSVNCSGPMPARTPSGKPRWNLARHGRGAAAAALGSLKLGPHSRRVVIKTRIVNLKQVTSQAVDAHLRYIAREGVGHNGQPTQPYGPETDAADRHEFAAAGRQDRHQFRFIVAPEDAVELTDTRAFTRSFMADMERDLGTRLEWIAVDHWDTDNPHTHVVLRGKDDLGKDLVIARDYITEGMRHRACGLATDWLGPRTEREIRESLERDVSQEAWTGLDRELQSLVRDGAIDLARPNGSVGVLRHRNLLAGRLQVLSKLELAREQSPGLWQLAPHAEPTLRALGERHDIIKTMQRALHGQPRNLAFFDPASSLGPVLGRIVSRGYSDELEERAYLIVDGVDGRAHHVPLSKVDLSDLPVGGIVEVRATPERAADRNVAALSKDGLYLTSRHSDELRRRGNLRIHFDEVVDGHVRRLEALRRAGIVQRVSEGVWRVPADLVARGQAYDRQRTGGVEVHLHSHLPIERQVTAIGGTWLDRAWVNDDVSPTHFGFGATVEDALNKRKNFLVEQGFAERAGDRVLARRDLLMALRQRDLEGVANNLTAETGKAYRPLVEGVQSAGVYRQMVLTASGRFAMLDDGPGFSLVPWRPILEQRIGQQLSATMRGGRVTWSFGRERGLSR